MQNVLTAQTADVADPQGADLERYRVELTGYCYRMLGSAFDAEDAVQETLVRAWRAREGFEGRASLRSWLYRIATNVCFDALKSRQRRARPMDLGPAGRADGPVGGTRPEATWIEPVPDERVVDVRSLDGADPAEVAVARESIRLAFVAALQHLPPMQRAVLILREVLCWRAAEVAALLERSVPAVNSSLQRARATLARYELDADEAPSASSMGQGHRLLLDRYLDAFECYDMERLTALLHEDATQSMPPYELWLQGREALTRWWATAGIQCRGSLLIPTVANGRPAFGQYRPSGPDGAFEPWALQVLEVVDGRIQEITFFLDVARIFPLFGLPAAPGPRDAALPTAHR